MASADFTIADVLAWARTKPADEAYRIDSAPVCALGQFGTATGRTYLNECFDPDTELSFSGLNEALGFNSNLKRTFGALVTRLEALCPETPIDASNWQAIDAYLTDIEDVARERVSA